jgi:hypothetical protein
VIGVLLVAPALSRSVTELTEKATAVVIGSVAAHTGDSETVEFTIAVERILKGTVPLSVPIRHIWTGRGGILLLGPNQTHNVRLRGMWFLIRDQSGLWDVLGPGSDSLIVDLFLPVSTTALGPPYSYSPSQPVSEIVLIEAAAGIKSSSADPETLLSLAWGMDNDVVRALLTDYMNMRSPDFQAAGLAGFLDRGRPGSIADLLRMWPSIDKSANRSSVIFALRQYWRDSTPESVRDLVSATALMDRSNELRPAAIWALMAMHTKETLPLLGSLLVSADATEQMQAVIGISAFANGCPIQTSDTIVNMKYLQCDSPSPYRPCGDCQFRVSPGNPLARGRAGRILAKLVVSTCGIALKRQNPPWSNVEPGCSGQTGSGGP